MLSHVTSQVFPAGMSLEAMSPRRIAVLFAFGILMGSLSVWAVSSLVVIPSLRSPGKCPHCQSQRIRSAWPRLSDRLLLWLRAFRCEACLRRFYVLRRQRAAG